MSDVSSTTGPWKAAWAFHAEGSREAERWVTERLLEILRGNASLVAGGMRRSATRQGLEVSPGNTAARQLFARYGIVGANTAMHRRRRPQVENET